MKKLKLSIVTAFIAALFFASCEKDDTTQDIYSNGVFIVNEGVYSKANATVGFFGYSADSITNNIFEKVNARPVGDLLQSICKHESKAYLIVNGSSKIEVVTAEGFKSTGVIEGLKNPRYMVVVNNIGYVSQWGQDPNKPGSVAVVNLATLKVTSTIATGTGPEGVTLIKDKIWVANCGGYVTDSTITIIDPLTNKVERNIIVGYNPQEVVEDKNGDVWVLCSGDWTGHTSSLDKLSGANNTLGTRFIIGSFDHPMKLEINKAKDLILYGGGFEFSGIWKVAISATSLPEKAFIDGGFYSLSINPNNDEIFAFDAGDFISNGKMIRYKMDGTKINAYTVGINPNGATF
jgi:YVTN family beta-propeller protein